MLLTHRDATQNIAIFAPILLCDCLQMTLLFSSDIACPGYSSIHNCAATTISPLLQAHVLFFYKH